MSSGQKPAGNEAGSARAIWGERLKGGGTGSTKQAKQMCDCGDEGRQDIQRAEMVWECGERPTSLCLTRASFRDTGSKGPCANKDPMLGLVACCHHSEIPNTFFFKGSPTFHGAPGLTNYIADPASHQTTEDGPR